jgi:hypothetical protein
MAVLLEGAVQQRITDLNLTPSKYSVATSCLLQLPGRPGRTVHAGRTAVPGQWGHCFCRHSRPLRGQFLGRLQDPAHRAVVNFMVATDGAVRYTGLALREDRGGQPRVFGSNTFAHNRFRKALPALDVSGGDRSHPRGCGFRTFLDRRPNRRAVALRHRLGGPGPSLRSHCLGLRGPSL